MDQRAKKKAPMPPKQQLQEPRMRSEVPQRGPAAGRPPEGKAAPAVNSGPSFGAWLTAIGTAGLQNSRNSGDYKRYVNEFYLSKVRDSLSKVSQQIQSDIQDRTMARLVMKSLVDTIAGGVGPIAQGTVLDPVRSDRAASVNDDVRTFAKLATTENDMNIQDTIKALRAAGYHKEAREVAALLKKAEHLEFQSPEDAQRSLDQFAENTSELYEAKLAVLRGLLKFMKANKYSSELAKRSWTRFLKQAAQRYVAEEGEPGDEKLFRAALPALVDEWEAHYATQLKSGEHDYLLEKKAMKKTADFEVLVGNIGTVLTTEDEVEARNTFEAYVSKSESAYGRASGESVTLMKDGEPIDEHEGSLDHEAAVKKASPEGWPTADEIASDLKHVAADLADDEEGTDVRLRVQADGDWELKVGLSDYDTDHRGYWGASSISSDSDVKAVAADLLDQAEEQFAMDQDRGASAKKAKLSPQQLGIIDGLLKDMDPQDPAYKALSEYAKGLKTQGPSKGTAVGIQSLAAARKARIATRKVAAETPDEYPGPCARCGEMEDACACIGPGGESGPFKPKSAGVKRAKLKKADGLGVSEGTIQTHMEMLEKAFAAGDFPGMARRLNEMKRDVDLAAKAPKKASTRRAAFDPRSAVVYFDLQCEDYNIEEDAENPESPDHDLAKKILADKDGRILLDLEFNALKQLTKILGTRIGNEGHANDYLVCKITSVNTVDDVAKLFDKLQVMSGDDVIDTGVPYFVAQGFTLFPEGVNGPQVKYLDFDDWKAEESEAPKNAFIDDEELSKKETSEDFDAEMEGLDEDDPEFKALQDRRNALGAALKRRARLAAQKKTGNRLTVVKQLAPLLKDLLDGGSTQEQPKNIQPQLKKLEAAGLIRHGKDQEGHLGWSLTADGREWLA